MIMICFSKFVKIDKHTIKSCMEVLKNKIFRVLNKIKFAKNI